MDVALNGNVNLAILQQFDQSITSSGKSFWRRACADRLLNPRLTGQVELHNASFDDTGLANRGVECEGRHRAQWR